MSPGADIDMPCCFIMFSIIWRCSGGMFFICCSISRIFAGSMASVSRCICQRPGLIGAGWAMPTAGRAMPAASIRAGKVDRIVSLLFEKSVVEKRVSERSRRCCS